MPYNVRKDLDRCPASRPWALIDEHGDKLLGCHPTREQAVAQQQAVGAQTHSRTRLTEASIMLASLPRLALPSAQTKPAPRTSDRGTPA